ncbi:MAG TPA: hypothetical protein VME47_18555 [Acetobacteraceae bacterium]|nr:hypothetical protein [Acetobacteraceae bacterium]
MIKEQRRAAHGLLLLALAATAATALSIFAYFNSEAINHTAGLLLVICTSAVMAVAALALGTMRFFPRWLRATGLLLLLIDIFGTGIAAWFLEARGLLALMGVALLAWLLHLATGPRTTRTQAGTTAESTA